MGLEPPKTYHRLKICENGTKVRQAPKKTSQYSEMCNLFMVYCAIEMNLKKNGLVWLHCFSVSSFMVVTKTIQLI